MLQFEDDMDARKKILSEIEGRLDFFAEHSISINGLKDDDYCWLPIQWVFDEANKRFVPSPENIRRIMATGLFEEHISRTCDTDARLSVIIDDLCRLLQRKFWYPKKLDKLQSYQFKRPQAE